MSPGLTISSPLLAVPLSQCRIWDYLNQYYQQGVSVFEHTPHKITNSAYLAECYAELLVTYLTCHQSQINFSQPVYILEMAAGTGRLSHLLLKELFRKLSYFPALQNLQITYVMSDFSEETVRFWEQHDQLKPYLDFGCLDFAVFDPLKDDAIYLRHGQLTLNPSTLHNPVMVLANYFFDSLPHDVYRISNGQLWEGLATLQQHDDFDPQQIDFSQLKLSYEYQPIAHTRYVNSHWNDIMEQYRHTLAQGTIIMPVGGLTVLDRLKALCSKGFLFLSSDKGWCNLDRMQTLRDFDFTNHNSVSYAVNFDAIRRYFQLNNAAFFETNCPHVTLQTVLGLLSKQPLHLDALRYQFAETVIRKNPMNYIMHLPQAFSTDSQTPVKPSDQIDGILAHIRLSCCETMVFTRHTDQLCSLTPEMSTEQKNELLSIMAEVCQNYYFYPSECNVLFFIGSLLFALGRETESLPFFEQAITETRLGEYETKSKCGNFSSLGMVHQCLGNTELAKAYYEQAVAYHPDFSFAQAELKSL